MNELGNLYVRDDIDLYNYTSWCKFPLNEADFGWGKPTWISSAYSSLIKNVAMLMDTKEGDGIEAWITLKKEEMDIFERTKSC